MRCFKDKSSRHSRSTYLWNKKAEDALSRITITGFHPDNQQP